MFNHLGNISGINTLGASAMPRAGKIAAPQLRPITFSGTDSVSRTEAVSPDYEPPRIKTFFESGTPFYFLHGTSSTGRRLAPLVDWAENETGGNHPVYVSYLPEVEQGTGIQNDSANHFAAYKMALRDMGDFTFQLVNLRANELKELLQKSSETEDAAEKTRLIGDYFNVLPEDRDWLVPIISRQLIEPVFKKPDAIEGSQLSLSELAAHGTGKVKREVAKLLPRKRDLDRQIFDTQFIKTLCDNQREMNIDMTVLDPDKVNLRAINFDDIAKMETYLALINKNLTQALANAMAAQESATPPQQVEKRAQAIADKLMQAIAPRGMAFGHSQGGTTLLLASLKTMENTKKPAAQQSRTIEGAGRFIGFSMLFNAPVMGMKDDHAIGEVIREEMEKWEEKIPFLKNRSDAVYNRLKSVIWSSQQRHRPAVAEMRAGSDLMKELQRLLPGIKDYADSEGFSLASVWDKDDQYVEKEASELQLRTGDEASTSDRDIANTFNIELNATQMHPRYRSPDDMMQRVSGVYGRMAGWLSTRLPNSLKEYAYKVYTDRLLGVEQHRALLMLPDYVSAALGRKMLDEPAPGKKSNLVQALDANSFEPFRSQSLQARRNMLRSVTTGKDPAEMAWILKKFLEDFDGYLSALVSNAAERSPLENSASRQAALLLDDTLDQLTNIVAEPKVRRQYQALLNSALREIAQGGLNYGTRDDGKTISGRAQQLLETFSG